MEDVSDKCWYCKAILPHHRRFGPLLRTTMSYEAMKRVFFLALPDGFVVKVLVANPILLYCVSYHEWKMQGVRSSPLGPALHIALIMFFFCYHGEKCSNQDTRCCPCWGTEKTFFFVRLKIAFWALCGSNPGSVQCAGPVPQRPPRRNSVDV